MTKINKTLKVCLNGYKFYKSSDCPVCPVCEKEKTHHNDFLSTLVAPARRALENAGIKSVAQLSKWKEKEILQLHGMGPSTIPKLKKALKIKGLDFSK